MSSEVRIPGICDIRSTDASAYSDMGLDDDPWACDMRPMLKAADILEILRTRKITQQQIADVLGITQPNANRLYAKVKPRGLYHDEALTLIERFELQEPPVPPAASAALNERVAELFVFHVADRLGLKLDRQDERVPDIALDLKALAQLVADPQVSGSLEKIEGFLQGLAVRARGRRAPKSA